MVKKVGAGGGGEGGCACLRRDGEWVKLLLVACLTSKQHASVSHGRVCSDNFTC